MTKDGRDIDDIVKELNIGGDFLRRREDVEREYQARRRALLGEEDTEFFREK